MEHFIERLDTLLDNDPFSDFDWNLLSPNDYEVLEKYRTKYLDDRKRIREERKTKTFEEIMEDLLQELSHKPDLTSFYRTLDDPLLTTINKSSLPDPLATSVSNKDAHTIELDTSADEQDDLDHCTTWIDPSKSIGRPIGTDELKSSTYVVYPLTKSPSVPPPSRKIQRYADQSRRNTYTLQDSSSSSSDDEQPLVNTKPEYVRLDSQGFDPQQQQENPFHHVKDARSTFSIPQKRFRFTRQEAQIILHRKLGAFIKGHLTRQLFRTEDVKQLIQKLNDTKTFAVDFQQQCLQTKTKLDPDDISIIDQLIQQVQSVLDKIHVIFQRFSSGQQMTMIVQNEQAERIRMRRTNQRIAKDFSIERPIIDPLPAATVKRENPPRQTEYRRPENIRRHVTAVPNRPAQSATNNRTRPLKQAGTVQRKSRPINSTNTEPTSNPPRSSSANNHIYRPPLRLAPASPLFRNRLK